MCLPIGAGAFIDVVKTNAIRPRNLMFPNHPKNSNKGHMLVLDQVCHQALADHHPMIQIIVQFIK